MRIKLNETGDLPLEIKDEYSLYRQDHAACMAIGVMLDSDIKAVYRAERHLENSWSDEHITLDCEVFYVVTKSNKVICFTNSEWGSIELDGEVVK